MRNVKVKDAVVSFKVHYNDIQFLAKNVIPTEKEDFATKLYNLIEETV